MKSVRAIWALACSVGLGLMAITLLSCQVLFPDADLPPRKRAIEAAEEQIRATAQALNNQPGVPKHLPTPEFFPETPPVLMHDTPVPGGTITDADEIFINLGIRAKNSWYAKRGNSVIRVYAGAIDFNPATQWSVEPKGILFEKGWTDNQLTNKGQIFHTPTNGGAVRIVAANGDDLYLQAEDGTKFTFDVATGEFK